MTSYQEVDIPTQLWSSKHWSQSITEPDWTKMKNLGSVRLEERQFEYDHGQTHAAVQMCTRADSSQEEGGYPHPATELEALVSVHYRAGLD